MPAPRSHAPSERLKLAFQRNGNTKNIRSRLPLKRRARPDPQKRVSPRPGWRDRRIERRSSAHFQFENRLTSADNPVFSLRKQRLAPQDIRLRIMNAYIRRIRRALPMLLVNKGNRRPGRTGHRSPLPNPAGLRTASAGFVSALYDAQLLFSAAVSCAVRPRWPHCLTQPGARTGRHWPMPLKPMNARDISPAIISAMGVPAMTLGSRQVSRRSRMAAISSSARVKPTL